MTTLDRRSFLGTAAALAAGAASLRAQDAAPRVGPALAGVKTRFAANVEIWWPQLPLLDRIREAKKAGFPGIELWPWQGKPLEEIAALCQELDMEVAQFLGWGFKPGLNDPANHDAFVQAVRDGCAAAKKLRTSKMTVIAGDDRPGVSQAEMHRQVVVGLKKAAPIAEEAGLMLILEPMNIRVDHKGHCLYGSAPAVAICREVNSPMVKINWDLYHMQRQEGDLCDRLREGFDQLGYVQVADVPGRREPGTGEVNWSRVFRELHELGYRHFVGAECWPLTTEAAALNGLRAAGTW